MKYEGAGKGGNGIINVPVPLERAVVGEWDYCYRVCVLDAAVIPYKARGNL